VLFPDGNVLYRDIQGKTVIETKNSNPKAELAEIAKAGYTEAALTVRKDREAAVSLFLSDTVWGLTQ
jgi:hypothetical protein